MRSRNIKPGFYENEDLAELDPLARILFTGLWCYADREGRFEWRPKRIKALILPYDDTDVTLHLMSLHAMTLILQYKVDGCVYGFIPNFKKHQNPHPHEARSILPAPEDGEILFASKAELIQCHDMSRECNADILIPDSLIPDSQNNRVKKPKTKTKASDFVLPGWVDPNVWSSFIEHRKILKSPMSIQAQRLAVTTLEKLKAQGNAPVDVINQSIERGWKGLFPVNGDRNQPMASPLDGKLSKKGQEQLEIINRWLAKGDNQDG
jgi:hypothetical protein